MYEVVYSDEALSSIAKYKKSSPQSYKKVLKLVKELHEHPKTGIGHPEALNVDKGLEPRRAVYALLKLRTHAMEITSDWSTTLRNVLSPPCRRSSKFRHNYP